MLYHRWCIQSILSEPGWTGLSDFQDVGTSISKGTALRNLNEAPVYLSHSEQTYASARRKVHV